jgi:hypothetical protein
VTSPERRGAESWRWQAAAGTSYKKKDNSVMTQEIEEGEDNHIPQRTVARRDERAFIGSCPSSK